MYTQAHLDCLNEHGILSTSFLVRKFKIGPKQAEEILRSLVENFENVNFTSLDQIYISGREPVCVMNKRQPYTKRKPKYVSVRRT
jgi:hypothetical protein